MDPCRVDYDKHKEQLNMPLIGFELLLEYAPKRVHSHGIAKKQSLAIYYSLESCLHRSTISF